MVNLFFEGKVHIIPLPDVAYVEKSSNGAVTVVLDVTTWNEDGDHYNNAPYIGSDEADLFLQAWYKYRAAQLVNTIKATHD